MQRASLQDLYCLDDTQRPKAAAMAVAFKGEAAARGSQSSAPTLRSSGRI